MFISINTATTVTVQSVHWIMARLGKMCLIWFHSLVASVTGRLLLWIPPLWKSLIANCNFPLLGSRKGNSDCTSDQQIKLQVRDAVAEELQTILHGAETKAETEEILRENEPSIRAAALQTLRAGGSTDDITVTYGKASFEEKETGNYILPAGTYDARSRGSSPGRGRVRCG